MTETAYVRLETELSEDEKLPPIHVTMGNTNTVDHIGHKITYHAPPLPPNAIRQCGNVVGTFEGQPSKQGNTYRFPLLVFSMLEDGQPFEIEGVKLRLLHADIKGDVTMLGFGRRITFQEAVCEIVV